MPTFRENMIAAADMMDEVLAERDRLERLLRSALQAAYAAGMSSEEAASESRFVELSPFTESRVYELVANTWRTVAASAHEALDQRDRAVAASDGFMRRAKEMEQFVRAMLLVAFRARVSEEAAQKMAAEFDLTDVKQEKVMAVVAQAVLVGRQGDLFLLEPEPAQEKPVPEPARCPFPSCGARPALELVVSSEGQNWRVQCDCSTVDDVDSRHLAVGPLSASPREAVVRWNAAVGSGHVREPKS